MPDSRPVSPLTAVGQMTAIALFAFSTAVRSRWVALPILLLSLLLHGCGFATLDHLLVQRNGGWVQAGGEIFVIREGKRIDAKQGRVLKKGDVIETGPDTTAAISFDGDLKGSGEVILYPSTRIRILNPSLGIDFGKIFLRVKGFFNIHFEYGTAGSEGTEYLVETGPDERVRVTVLEGVVKLSSKTGAWRPVRLHAREQAGVTRGQAPTARRLEQREFNDTINDINRVWEGTGRRDISIIVPDIGGMPQQQAVEQLQRERLQRGDVKRRLSQQARVGSVLRQMPVANARVPISSRVDMEVEAEPASVPKLRGLSQRRAVQRLQKRKLHLGNVEQVLSEGRVGSVAHQSPAAGTVVMVDTGVDLAVVAESALVPDLQGVMLQKARQRIAGKKLRLGRVDYRMTGRVAVDQVLSQQPEAGVRVFSQSEISLVVEAQSVLIPNLIGENRVQAERQIESLRLALGHVQTRRVAHAEAGSVLEQTPAPGTRVAPGSRVDLTLAAEVVTVPGLIGSQYDNALQRLQALNLRVGSVESRLDDRSAAGSVVDQYPLSGTMVDPQSSVTLVVAEEGVRVPHVVGDRSQQAISKLSAAGLGHTSSYQETERYANDTVIRQSINSPTLVRKGVQIHLTLARVKPKCYVPAVGQAYQQAVTDLQNKGFNVNIQGRYSNSSYVRSQSPAGGSYATCGSTVSLFLGTRQPPPAKDCRVPQLTGGRTSYQQAVQALNSAGLKLNVQGRADQSSYVRSQYPSAGTLLKCGSTVTLSFTSPQQPPPTIYCSVPNVVGSSYQSAEKTLQSKRLKAITSPDSVRSGTVVVSQSPSAGKSAKCGSYVSLKLGTLRVPVQPMVDPKKIPWGELFKNIQILK